jgi:hypothetical protein
LCEYVAIKLARGSYDADNVPKNGAEHNSDSDQDSQRLGRRTFPVLLGLRPVRRIDQNRAVEAFIESTKTEAVGGRWYEIAEKEFGLPQVR